MKNKKNVLYSLVVMLAGVIYFPVRTQQKNDVQNAVESEGVTTSQGPKGIVRTLIKDRKGDIWIASWEGVFRYDGKSFTNFTNKLSSSHFFSVLEDRKGNLWFGSIGAGVYCYEGKSFKNFTTKEGLAGNSVTCIYEDKTGKIWFGTEGGASCYDGKSFRNYTMNGGVNAIIEDKTGKFWFGTGSNACIYDGKTFTVFTNKGKPFTNVRSVIEDKKGDIWLGGNDGLWRYSGSTFTNFTRDFVGYIYEDKNSNIWTSSQYAQSEKLTLPRYDEKSLSGSVSAWGRWMLSRYDEKSLSSKRPVVTELEPGDGMICGILEADDGRIWFGTSGGVYRYDGNTIIGFKVK